MSKIQEAINEKFYSSEYPDVPKWIRISEAEHKKVYYDNTRSKPVKIMKDNKTYYYDTKTEACIDLGIARASMNKSLASGKKVGNMQAWYV